MSILVSAFTVVRGRSQLLEIAQGEDREFRLTFTESGTPIDFSGASAIVMTVRMRSTGELVFARSYSGFQGGASAGTPRFQILQADTEDLLDIPFDVDVSWTDSSGYKTQLLATSTFLVLRGIGRAGDPLSTPPAIPVVYGLNWLPSGLPGFWTSVSGGYQVNDAVMAYDGSLGGTGISTFRAVNAGVTIYPLTSGQSLATGWAYVGQHGGGGSGGGAGTVTSVALSVPSFLSVSGSPITSSGTLAISLANQTANRVFAGPSTGSAAAPTFRALVAADIPDLSATYLPLGGGTMSGAIVFSGTQTGTYTLGGTPTIASPTLSGTVSGTPMWASAQTFPSPMTVGNLVLSATGLTAARTFTFPDATDVVDVLGQAQTFTAIKTFNAAPVFSAGATASGSSSFNLSGSSGAFQGPTGTSTFNGPVAITPPASTGTPTRGLTFTAPAHTALTASTEFSSVLYDLSSTQQFSAGAITTQRAFRVAAPTYTSSSSMTITNAATFAISGAPSQAGSLTITNPFALWVQAGDARFDGQISFSANVVAKSISSGTGTAMQLTGNPQDTASVYAVRMGPTSSVSSASLVSIDNPIGTIQLGFNNLGQLSFSHVNALIQNSNQDGLITTSGNVFLRIAGSSRYQFSTNAFTLTPTANTNNTLGPIAFKLTGAAHTQFQSLVEYMDVYYNLARTVTLTAPAGDFTGNERVCVVEAPTLAFTGASSKKFKALVATWAFTGAPIVGANTDYSDAACIVAAVAIQNTTSIASSGTTTAASSLYIQGAPTSGGTITNAYAVWVDAGTTRLDGDFTHQGTNFGMYNATPVAQFSSTGESTGFTAGAGTTVTHLSTFTGNTGTKAYTISDIVKALKTIGLLAGS